MVFGTKLLRRGVVLIACAIAFGGRAETDEASPQLPPVLTLQSALDLFHRRGFDLLVAEANVSSASGDLAIAGGLPNPGLSFAAGKNFHCAASQDCKVISYSASVSDNNLISNFLTGKRGLRKDFAEAALQAARSSRDDARRTLDFTLKQSWYQLLLALAQRDVARENRDSFLRTRQLNEKRYELGAMSGADLATIQVAELEAEQSLDTAEQGVRTATVALGFLLGFRGPVPDFNVDAKGLAFAVPARLAGATRESLIADALKRRPDLEALRAQERRAQAGLSLAKRNRVPDFGFSLTYSANGSGDTNISPPNGSIGVSFTPSLLYFQGGEIRKAEADVVTQSALRHKAEAQTVSDVETSWAQFQASRRLVERMQASLLDSAQKARDLVRFQYEKGAASLLDLLNAQRTFAATRAEYAQDLSSYWIAVGQLEQAAVLEPSN